MSDLVVHPEPFSCDAAHMSRLYLKFDSPTHRYYNCIGTLLVVFHRGEVYGTIFCIEGV